MMAVPNTSKSVVGPVIREHGVAAGEADDVRHGHACRDDHETTTEHSTTPTISDAGAETPIVYRYLTFETQLPQPCVASDRRHALPAQPDLRKYTSPFEWSQSRKTFTLLLSCIATMFTAYTAGSYSPPEAAMAAEWAVSTEDISIGITTFCCGFAFAPMMLAPFSEINGRYPVFLLAGILFEICQICCAVCTSYAGMLTARFFVGVGSSVFSTMVGGVISDIYHSRDRNTPMAIFSGFVVAGTGLGPLVSGFIAQNLNWRWVFWLQTITCGTTILAIALFFKETRGSILLSRKAKCLNKWYEQLDTAGCPGLVIPAEDDNEKMEVQRLRWKVKSDEERESIHKMVGISVYRPFHLLFTEPVVFFFSLWISFAWAVLYLCFSSIPLVFSATHDFNIQESGAVFASLIVAAIIITVMSIYQERASDVLFAGLNRRAHQGLGPGEKKHNPEQRLYFSCFYSALLPVGLFWFGWTQFSHIPWIVPVMGIGCASMGIFSIYLATFNYLADVYHRYASSALAAQSFCRNIVGGLFPLATPLMYKRLTFQGASSLLGGVALLLTLVPWVLAYYGPRIRARSKFAREIM